jgi:hypothetical protein
MFFGYISAYLIDQVSNVILFAYFSLTRGYYQPFNVTVLALRLVLCFMFLQ